MAQPTTASALIKALRSPDSSGSFKIAIAQHCLDNLRAPRVADIIADWILDTWSRSKPSPTDPIVDPDYHRLLHIVCNSARPFPAASFFRARPQASVLPLALETFRRLDYDADAAWAELVAFLEVGDVSPDLISLISPRVTTPPSLASLASAALRHPSHDLTLTLPLYFAPSFPSLSSLPSTCLAFIPTVLTSFISHVTTHRYALNQPSSSKVPYDVFISSKVRAAIHDAVDASLAAVSAAAEPWPLREAIWSAVVAWGGYLETTPWPCLANTSAVAQTDLSPHALLTLALLESLDHNTASITILDWLIAPPPSLQSPARSVLAALLRYHRLSRTVDQLYRSLVSTVDTLFTAAPTLDLYRVVVSGPLLTLDLPRLAVPFPTSPLAQAICSRFVSIPDDWRPTSTATPVDQVLLAARIRSIGADFDLTPLLSVSEPELKEQIILAMLKQCSYGSPCPPGLVDAVLESDLSSAALWLLESHATNDQLDSFKQPASLSAAVWELPRLASRLEYPSSARPTRSARPARSPPVRPGSGRLLRPHLHAIIPSAPIPLLRNLVTQRRGMLQPSDIAAILSRLLFTLCGTTVADTIFILTHLASQLDAAAVPLVCAIFSHIRTTSHSTSRLLTVLSRTPLAKHAPAILVAYVRAAGDPRSPLPPSVRSSLQPGLLALCDAVPSDQHRYELVGLPWGLGEGPGGEAETQLWGDLWRLWRARRYKGQG
ncbi:hypothetical protein JCM24511_05724 [Saitozyma sp. JCM 24511]|nr:hypothetical protein JCM24511_05724 [Saitozyma sp. JCM 24511]